MSCMVTMDLVVYCEYVLKFSRENGRPAFLNENMTDSTCTIDRATTRLSPEGLINFFNFWLISYRDNSL